MMKPIQPNLSQATPPSGRRGASVLDRASFAEASAAYHEELLAAARSEILHRIEQDEIAPHALTPADLLEEALLKAWNSRRHRLPEIGMKPWLVAMIFLAAENACRREATLSEVTSPTTPLPDPSGLDEDEDIWGWHQLEDLASRRRPKAAKSARSVGMTPAVITHMAETLGATAVQAYILHMIYRLPVRSIAQALDIPCADVENCLTKARVVAARSP